ncbi:LacI family DNA-binding transcriptional regulator [Prevotella sp. PINT]|jgi:Transcriptional regulators|uniref:LacI family DNA-binding transcriptional regulator n=1 Tax=Palleniella intestinalis TaxID=2736291 RepID=UPI0015532DB0|nr:LacI family DNA-binding transcriptional regulator [Palleniella intestinalis]NPD81478.1 LacI family DNA-binding transcriptional regulator [Palleniella intestinalis]
MSQKVTIKDIAKRAGVSVGTVDRVLHNRPNVSKSALEKVKNVLETINYQPNAYASAMATNRHCTFYLLLPKKESEDYWTEVEEGAMHAVETHRDFKINVRTIRYDRFCADSFHDTCLQCMTEKPDGVIVVPASLEYTRTFTDKLHELDIPFIFLDSYLPDLKPLAFYGQDPFCSGQFAAKMMMLVAGNEKEIMLMKQTRNGNIASKQQYNREVGFRHYINEHYPEIKVIELDLLLEKDAKTHNELLEKFFENHPKIHHCITFTSKAYIVAEFIQRTNRRNVQIMGYDMIKKNAECIRQGSISFLIAQHGYMQGYNCVDALFRAIILKQEVNPVNYMPIELLTKENVDFYQHKQI